MSQEFKFGLSTGAIVCAWILLQYAFGLHTQHVEIGQYAGLLSNLIPAIALFWLLRKKQSQHWEGTLSFARGIFTGAQMSFVAALVVYTFLALYHHWINPEWVENVLQWRVNRMRASGLEESVIREQITVFRDAYSPTGLAFNNIVGRTLQGSLMAFVITAVLRFTPKPAVR